MAEDNHPSLSAEELVEKVDREVAIQAASKFCSKHVDLLTEIREKYPVDGSALLTENLLSSGDISANIKNEVTLLRQRIRQVILHCASAMEERKYRDTLADAANIPGMKQKQSAMELIEAEKRLHISCQTLKLTVDLFNHLNDEIVLEADKDDRKLSANAVLVSELAGFVIEYMNEYNAEGFGEIERLYKESAAQIQETRNAIKRNRAQLEDQRIPKEERDRCEAENSEHEQALDIMDSTWRDWLNDNNELVRWASEAKNMIPALEARKNSADVRLDVIHGITLLRAVKENATAMKAATMTIGKLRMPALPVDKVRKLIGG